MANLSNINNKFLVTTGGNVGIGVTGPAAKLTVNENAAGLVSSITNSSSSGSGVQITAGNGTNNSLQIRNYAGGELMRVQGNGNVGIGTTSPKTSLDIVKDSDIWHLMVGGATKKLLVGGQAASGDVVLQAGAASTVNNAAVTTPYNLCLQRDGGNVGIGTASPFSTAKLQVKTATDKNLAIQTGTTNTTGIKINAFNDAGSANIPLELNGSILSLKTGETEKLRITSTGDIELASSSRIVLDDQPAASTASGSGTIVKWSVSDATTAGTLYTEY